MPTRFSPIDPENVRIRDWTVPKDGSDVDGNPYSFAGGVFVSLVAPAAFSRLHEYAVAVLMVAGALRRFASQLGGPPAA